MAYLSESRLSNLYDLPVSLPATTIKMGDWLVAASVKVVVPMKLTYRYMALQLVSASVRFADVSSLNRVYGNLGNVYLTVRKDYAGEAPGSSGAIETMALTEAGLIVRDSSQPLVLTDPGTYSWVLANNCKADSSSLIPAATSIDFVVAMTGQVRMEVLGA